VRWRPRACALPRPMSPARIIERLLHGAGREGGDRLEEASGILARPLERVAPDDRAKSATVADGAHLLEHRLIGVGGATGEDHDATATEGGLNDVTHSLAQRAGRHGLLLVDLAGRGLLEMGRWQLDLDD